MILVVLPGLALPSLGAVSALEGAGKRSPTYIQTQKKRTCVKVKETSSEVYTKDCNLECEAFCWKRHCEVEDWNWIYNEGPAQFWIAAIR